MLFVCLFVSLMVFNATFSNISTISWPSVLMVEETEGTGENHLQLTSHENNDNRQFAVIVCTCISPCAFERHYCLIRFLEISIFARKHKSSMQIGQIEISLFFL
jgi:hypothetical protein